MADCVRTRDTLSTARSDIYDYIINPLETYRIRFLPVTMDAFLAIQVSQRPLFTAFDVQWCHSVFANWLKVRGQVQECENRENTEIVLLCLPCMALSWGRPTWQGLGFSGLVHEETHPCGSYFIQCIFETVQAGCINSVLVQTVLSVNDSIWEKNIS